MLFGRKNRGLEGRGVVLFESVEAALKGERILRSAGYKRSGGSFFWILKLDRIDFAERRKGFLEILSLAHNQDERSWPKPWPTCAGGGFFS